jgi:hypothetical protein
MAMHVERSVGRASPPRSLARVAAVGGASSLLAVLVASTSHDLPARVRHAQLGGGVASGLGDVLVVLLALVVAAVPLIASVSWRDRRRQPSPAASSIDDDGAQQAPPDRGLLVLPLAIAAVAALVLVVGALYGTAGHERAASSTATGGTTVHGPTARGGGALSVSWPLVGVLAVLAVVVGAVALLRARRRRTADTSGEDVELVAAVDESLDDLVREPDARRAVIAAYARMERALAGRGVERQPSETALEYLSRALVEARASERSARRLTTLFQRARFSQHGVDEAMKGDALDALRSLRAELGA